MPTGLLGIASTAIMANQRQLATTGHNIANVNTPGYHRQTVDLTEMDPSFEGGQFMGNGVRIATIARSYDNYLDTQVRTSLSASKDADTYFQLAQQIDNVTADPATSLASSLQDFFDAAQAVANDPTSTAARQLLLSNGSNLAQRFATLNTRMDQLREQVDQSLTPTVEEINGYTQGIAKLNESIVAAYSQASGNPPNDLIDQRDLLVEKLSGKMDVQVVKDSTGAINVYAGNGPALVLNNQAVRLGVQASAYDPFDKDIVIENGEHPIGITQSVQGGELGGSHRFTKDVLDPAQNELGRLAAGISVLINDQQRTGSDSNGNPGVNLFSDLTDPSANRFTSFGKNTNTGDAVLTVAFDNAPGNGPAELAASDYHMDYDGSTYTLTRLGDNTRFTAATPEFAVDGLRIGVESGDIQAGDSFLLRPERGAAGRLSVDLTDPALVAAGGIPPGGPGDNTNARALADLQHANSLLGGKASFGKMYTHLVGDIGTKTQAADIQSTAQKLLLEQATSEREAVSGVNLDEEAANLVNFQQAYQASAQLISTANETFNSLLGAMRG